MNQKKIGIMTFHASYNCGSMLQAYALQTYLHKHGYQPEIVDFSSEGQQQLYAVYNQERSLKGLVKNSVIFLHRNRIVRNNARYEAFKSEKFHLSQENTSRMDQLTTDCAAVIAGADQIWNITIADYDDAYFLPWVSTAKRIAYAPSFGARNPVEYAENIEKYKQYLLTFDSLSIREKNGCKWIEDMIGKKVPVVLDPTLLLEREDYAPITASELKLPEKYIFYYAPGYSKQINQLVKKISRKYRLPVIAFNSKSFYLRRLLLYGFRLPQAEDPTTYLQLMKNAAMVITTSFHGTIFGAMFERPVWTIMNGNMLGTDDRVKTLLTDCNLEDRLIQAEFSEELDYLKKPDYPTLWKRLSELRQASEEYLLSALKDE